MKSFCIKIQSNNKESQTSLTSSYKANKILLNKIKGIYVLNCQEIPILNEMKLR